MNAIKRPVVYRVEVWIPEMDGSHPLWGLSKMGIHQVSSGTGDAAEGMVQTPEGQKLMRPGDYLLTDPNGVRYVRTPGEFAADFVVQADQEGMPNAAQKTED
jgi:hypothetical protein